MSKGIRPAAQQLAKTLWKNRKAAKRWQKVLSALVCVVTFCTTYALILPAITLSSTPQCGLPEHTHIAACYHSTRAEAMVQIAEDELKEARDAEFYQNWLTETVEALPQVSEGDAEWSAAFLSYCLEQAAVSQEELAYGQNAFDWYTANIAALRQPETPTPGDMVLLTTPVSNGSGAVFTVGVVVDTDENSLTAIVGTVDAQGENERLVRRRFDWPCEDGTLMLLALPEGENPLYNPDAEAETEAELDGEPGSDNAEPTTTPETDAQLPEEDSEFAEGEAAHVFVMSGDLDVSDQHSTGSFAASLGSMPLNEPPAPLEMGSGNSDAHTGTIYAAIIKWHENHPPVASEQLPGWKDWPSGPNPSVPADAHLRFEIKFKDLDPATLKNAGYAVKYTPNELFRDIQAEGNIVIGSNVVGTVHVENGAVVLKFDEAWVDALVEYNNANEDDHRYIIGNFFYQAEFDLSKLEENKNDKLNLGGVEFDLPKFDDARAQFGEMDITKTLNEQASGKHYIEVKDESGKSHYYLEYTITVKNGADKMDNVVVKDTLTGSERTLATPPYVGVTDIANEITSFAGNTSPATGPVETSTVPLTDTNRGTGWLTASGNSLDTGSTVPYPNNGTGDLVWNIGHMEANETRTLTYRVQLDDSYIGIHHDSSSVTNDAALTSKGYPHSHQGTRFNENATAQISKSRGGVTQEEIGGKLYYRIPYTLTITAPADNKYPMTNVLVRDDFTPTDDIYEKYGKYVLDSVKVKSPEYKDNDAAKPATVKADGTAYTDLTDGDVTFAAAKTNGSYTYNPGFAVNVGDLAPGETATVTYEMLFEAGHDAEANEVGIYNHGSVHNDPSKDATPTNPTQLDAENLFTNPSGQRWMEKSNAQKTTLPVTLDMGSDKVYAANGDELTNPGSFTVDAGAYRYVVDVNEKGLWDISGATFSDKFGTYDEEGTKIPYMLFSGYARVDMWVDGLDTGELYKTVWVNLDGQGSMNLKLTDFPELILNDNDHNAAYRLTYYADVNPNAAVGTVTVSNTFGISGDVISPGGNSVTLPNMSVQKNVTVTGDYKFTTTKEFWYYDPDDTDFFYDLPDGTRVYTGAMYWAIRVDANKIMKNSAFQESVNPYTSYNNILRKEHSYQGFYVGNIEGLSLKEGRSDKKLADVYETLTDALDSGNLRPVTFSFDLRWSSGGQNNNNGWSVAAVGAYGETLTNGRGVNQDMTISLNETVALAANESLYLLVKTEPYRLPDDNGVINTQKYENKCNVWDGTQGPPHDTWPHHPNATTTLTGGTSGVQKNPGGVYIVRNNTATRSGTEGKDANYTFMWNGKNTANSTNELLTNVAKDWTEWDSNIKTKGNLSLVDGTYVTWHISANTTGQLNGSYYLEDIIPDGLELAYVRTYEVNKSLDPFSLTRDVFFNQPGNGNANVATATTYNGLGYNENNGFQVAVTSPHEWPDDGNGTWTQHKVASRCSVDGPDYCLNEYNRTATFYATRTNTATGKEELRLWMPLLQRSSDTARNGSNGNYSSCDKQLIFQVVCRVTDPNIYFEDVEFTNTAALYNNRNKQIDADSAVIRAHNGSLSKTDLANLAESSTITDAEIPYSITINDTGSDMDPSRTTMTVPLVDRMSSNLSMDVESLRIYVGSARDENLIYSGGVEQTVSPGTNGEQLYQAIDADGQRLYWQEVPLSSGQATPFVFDTDNKLPAVHNGRQNGFDQYSANTDYFYAKTSAANSTATADRRIENIASDASNILDGLYIIQASRSGHYVTQNLVDSNKLAGSTNIADAAVWTLTRNGSNASGLTVTLRTDAGYLTTSNNSATFSGSPVTLNLRKFTINNNASFKAHGVLLGLNSAFLNQNGGASSSKYAGWSGGTDDGSSMYLIRRFTSTPVAANQRVFWNEGTPRSTEKTVWPVLTTDPNTTLYGVAQWKPVTEDAASGNVTGNVENAFHSRDEKGNLLYDGNTPVKETTTIRVSVEAYKDANGVADGSQCVKFHNLPDSVPLIIQYSVTATLKPGQKNSFFNDAYWEGHEASEGGSTSTNSMIFQAGGTVSTETHGAVRITKFDAADTTKKLSGATFALFRADYQSATAGKVRLVNADGTYIRDFTQDEITALSIPAVFHENGTPDDETDDIEITVDRVAETSSGYATRYPAYRFYDLHGNPIADITAQTEYRHHVLYEKEHPDHVLLDANFADGDQVHPKVFLYDGTGSKLFYAHDADGKRIADSSTSAYNGYQTTTVDTGDPCLDNHVLAIGTTNEAGVVTYGYSDDQTNIHFNKIYAIVEVEAPDGYDIDSTHHYFVVPSETNSGYHMDYFMHENGHWPANVHVVTDDSLTYMLNVYDPKASLRVTKDFDGITAKAYRPGTYTFGLWDKLLGGVPDGEPLDTKTITYNWYDFGYIEVTAGTAEHPTAYTAYQQNGGKWYKLQGTWTTTPTPQFIDTGFIATLLTDADIPEGLPFGILPGHQKEQTFSGLSFNKTYYVFELDDNGMAIVPDSKKNPADTANSVKMSAPVNGIDTTVEYSPAGDFTMPGGASAVVVNAVTPYKDNRNQAVAPMVKVTNTTYTAQATKSFRDNNGITIAAGLPGTYTFGLYAAKVQNKNDPDHIFYEPDLSAPLQTASVTWSYSEASISHKTATFDNLSKGKVYFIYELNDAGEPIVDSHTTHIISGAEFATDYFNVGYHTQHNGPKIYKAAEHTDANVWENAFMAGFEDKVEGGVVVDTMVPTVNITNTTSYFELPHTGGIGTTLFYVVGAVLAIGAAVLLIAKFRMRGREEDE